MPERGQSRVDAGIIAVVAVTTGAFVALTGHGLVAALATVVGVLIEVPVMLLVVRWVNASKGWYEAGLKP